jgi:hypothetical protein
MSFDIATSPIGTVAPAAALGAGVGGTMMAGINLANVIEHSTTFKPGLIGRWAGFGALASAEAFTLHKYASVPTTFLGGAAEGLAIGGATGVAATAAFYLGRPSGPGSIRHMTGAGILVGATLAAAGAISLAVLGASNKGGK